MKYWPKLLFLIYTGYELLGPIPIKYEVLFLYLIIVATIAFKEKFRDTTPTIILIGLLIVIGATMDERLALLFSIPIFDFVSKRVYLGAGASLLASSFFLSSHDSFFLLLLMFCLSGLLAYTLQQSAEREQKYTATLDDERRLRYELEQAKIKLLHSSKEIATIAEVKERNRIAREIHDSIGHSIAAVLIQLQAAHKLFAKDQDKALGILAKSIEHLSSSVEMIRNTVHNIKPKESLGIEYIQSILTNFSFCPIDFTYSGDFNQVPANHLEIIATNMKEALTNASRYSRATKVEIQIEASQNYTRLYIKDNGIGCSNVKEGLGLSGMKERIRNIGGSISISSNDGFLIVCLLPRQEGSELFEGTVS